MPIIWCNVLRVENLFGTVLLIHVVVDRTANDRKRYTEKKKKKRESSKTVFLYEIEE